MLEKCDELARLKARYEGSYAQAKTNRERGHVLRALIRESVAAGVATDHQSVAILFGLHRLKVRAAWFHLVFDGILERRGGTWAVTGDS